MKKVMGVILALFLVIVPVMAVTADAAELDDLSAARKGAEVFEAWYIQKYDGYDFLMNQLHSPAQIVVDLKKDDPTWNAALATWRVATFDLKSEWDRGDKELGYYDSLIFNILYDEKSESIGTSVLSAYVDSVGDVEKAAKKVSASTWKKVTGAYSDLTANTKIDLTDTEKATKVFNSIKTANDLNTTFSKIGDYTKYVGYCTTYFEFVEKAAKVETLLQSTDETAAILKSMVSRCSDNELLSTALNTYGSYLSGEISTEAIDAIFAGKSALNEVMKTVASKLWKEVIGILSGVGYSVSLGQTVGKFASDTLFGTSSIINGYYELEAVCEFENIMRAEVASRASSFRSYPTTANAKEFIAAYKLLNKTFIESCNCCQKFWEKAQSEGMLSSFINKGKEEDFQKIKKSITSMKGGFQMTLDYLDTNATNMYYDTLTLLDSEDNTHVTQDCDVEPLKVVVTEPEIAICANSLESSAFAMNNQEISKDMKLNQDMETYGNVILTGGTLDLNGHTLTVHGNILQRGGTMYINNGTLRVDGDYEIVGSVEVDSLGNKKYQNFYFGQYISACLKMECPQDLIEVGGDFAMCSNESDDKYLTAGTIKIGGNFTQIDDNTGSHGFSASGNHKVIFNGTRQQSISFESPSHCGFSQVEFQNQNIKLLSEIRGFPLSEDLTLNCDLALYGGSLDLNGHTLTVYGNLTMSNGSNLDLSGGKMAVHGNILQRSGTMYINNGTLKVDGDYEIADIVETDSLGNKTYDWSYGYLKMTCSRDLVEVSGDFTMYSGIDHSSYLTNGVMKIGGNFTQLKYNSNYNFDCTADHKVIFNGTGQQSISFESPDRSGFSHMEIANTAGSVSFTSECRVKTELRQSGGAAVENPENVKLGDEMAFENHYEINDKINAFVGNALGVTPTWLDYQKYMEEQTKPKYLYTIQNISLETSTGNPLAEIPNGQAFVVNVDVIKNEPSDEKDYIFVAAYSTDNQLLSTDYVQAKFVDNYTYSFGFHIPAQSKKIGTVKAFVWHSFSSMAPLAEAVSLQ